MFNKNEAYREHLAELNRKYPDRMALTMEECAKELGVSVRTISRMVDNKKNPLPSIKVRGRRMFTKVNLAMYMCGK